MKKNLKRNKMDYIFNLNLRNVKVGDPLRVGELSGIVSKSKEFYKEYGFRSVEFFYASDEEKGFERCWLVETEKPGEQVFQPSISVPFGNNNYGHYNDLYDDNVHKLRRIED
jgi:hypothetical protein